MQLRLKFVIVPAFYPILLLLEFVICPKFAYANEHISTDNTVQAVQHTFSPTSLRLGDPVSCRHYSLPEEFQSVCVAPDHSFTYGLRFKLASQPFLLNTGLITSRFREKTTVSYLFTC